MHEGNIVQPLRINLSNDELKGKFFFCVLDIINAKLSFVSPPNAALV